jgi:Ca-activated chloride channel family protein
MADFQSQFQWFIGFGFVVVVLDLSFLEKRQNG